MVTELIDLKIDDKDDSIWRALWSILEKRYKSRHLIFIIMFL